MQRIHCKRSIAKISLQRYLCTAIDRGMAENPINPETVDSAPPTRELDLESLKALSHPLRVQIVNALSIYGPATASGLAERFGESSGATSYHLRQLERHGFIREVEGRGTGRERWWERVPGGLNIGSSAAEETPAGRSAAQLIFREFQQSNDRLLVDFTERGPRCCRASGWTPARSPPRMRDSRSSSCTRS